MKQKMMKTLSALLVLALLMNLLSASVLAAAADQEGNNDEEMVSAQADDLEITGDGSMGNLIANALNEEQGRAAEDVNISSLSFNGTTAAVTYSTEGMAEECDLVVAVYADGQEPEQMLASGTVSVLGGGYK